MIKWRTSLEARREEDKNRVLWKLPLSNIQGYNLQKPNYSGQKFVRDWQRANSKVADPTNVAKTGSSGWQGRRIFHNLSPAEVNEKMRKGECFTCEEKYNPARVCKNKQFRLMIMEEEDEGETLAYEMQAVFLNLTLRTRSILNGGY